MFILWVHLKCWLWDVLQVKQVEPPECSDVQLCSAAVTFCNKVPARPEVLATFEEAAPHDCGILYRLALSLWKMSRRNWYFSLGSLSLRHVSGAVIWVHADLYHCTLLVGLTENSSIGFRWGVFHLRQSSLPFPPAASLTAAIYLETKLFSVLFDLRFPPDASSTEVWGGDVLPNPQ